MNDLSVTCAINTVGYGMSGYNIWKALRQHHKISLFPIGPVEAEKHWIKDDIITDIKNQQKYSINEPCLKIWHPYDLLTKPHTKNSIYATYSFFEIDTITDLERAGYNISDIIFTPSQWAKNILIQNNIDANKIVVCPCGVDTEVFDHTIDMSTEVAEKNNYIFMNIGKWEIRKGHDMLVHMFNNAFESSDNVELWMANVNPFLKDSEHEQWKKMYKNTKLGDKIHLLPRFPSQVQLAKVMQYCDCGIYPARAEGWNNEALETMAMNKPIILTNFSAHTEYANKDNSYLIDLDETEIAEDGKFFHSTGKWGKLNSKAIDQGVEHMRYVYTNNITTNQSGLDTANKLSWNKTAEIIGSYMYG